MRALQVVRVVCSSAIAMLIGGGCSDVPPKQRLWVDHSGYSFSAVRSGFVSVEGFKDGNGRDVFVGYVVVDRSGEIEDVPLRRASRGNRTRVSEHGITVRFADGRPARMARMTVNGGNMTLVVHDPETGEASSTFSLLEGTLFEVLLPGESGIQLRQLPSELRETELPEDLIDWLESQSER